MTDFVEKINLDILKKNTSITEKKGYKFTKDLNIAIIKSDSNFLYIKQGYHIDSSPLLNLINNNFIKKIEENKNIISINDGLTPLYYDVYQFYKHLLDETANKLDEDINEDEYINENDCLQFGECLTYLNHNTDKNIFEELLRKKEIIPMLKSNITNETFSEGEGYKQYPKYIKKIDIEYKNNKAVPIQGETYAIVRKKTKDGEHPYHIGYVLYNHDGVNITLEASAGNGYKYYPTFNFYDTNEYGNTFHRTYNGEKYLLENKDKKHPQHDDFYTNGETIVLKSRPIDDILNDMANESIVEPVETKKRSIEKTPPLKTKKRSISKSPLKTKRTRLSNGGKKE